MAENIWNQMKKSAQGADDIKRADNKAAFQGLASFF